MALIKQIILDNGIPTNYHHIQTLTKVDDILTVVIGSYVNKQYRELSVNNFVTSKYYNFENHLDDISYTSAYNLLKTTEDFSDAQDD